MKIGQYTITTPVILAPMAGVTDRPFRTLCKRLNAGMVVSEMVSSRPELLQTPKNQLRMNHIGEASPRIVQIAGGEAKLMADCAKYNVDNGAEIIDINMGCPAKKVCNRAAGSALLKDEALVKEILHTVVNAVNVPVTLKIRTGWDRANKNGIKIAHIAESEGIQALAVHGRTRADRYKGNAEYDTIAAIKSAVSIPIIANGDIDTPEKAKYVLSYTKADAVMVGRAAQGYPWIFREIDTFLKTGNLAQPPSQAEIKATFIDHITQLHDFYGEQLGVRIARKHIAWFSKCHTALAASRHVFNTLDTTQHQLAFLQALN